ncbi:AI-2E family transporter [Ferrimicrobium acidiphilum]|uniref:AI-2 transport protein TqsA n=1 Tax=Ferrimicrobium acidiphilum DSM 19497 TaxID=1121877 RepID=A0A0D8FUB6_9ACTN|nr:AI-2E family transporter [Ferrimicrobium acidiphilum]KJE76873.1 AI-2 transport protein TqsA [Ferrimicrobium acidiphilum DSM 19497]
MGAGETASRYAGLGKQIFLAEVGLLGIVLALAFVMYMQHLAIEVLVAIVGAIIVEPLVKLLMRLRFPRGAAVALTVFVAAAVLVGILLIFSVPLYSAGIRLANDLPALIRTVTHKKTRLVSLLTKFHIEHYLNLSAQGIAKFAGTAVGPALLAAKGVLSFLTDVVITAMLTVFFSLEGPRGIDVAVGLLPSGSGKNLRSALHETAVAVSGYVLGNLATSIIAGVVVYVAFRSLGLPFALLVAVWVGLVDLIPLVGGLLAGIPAVGLALLHGLVPALILLVVFLVYQQIENHLLNPVVLSRTVQLNPLWILLAVLIGAQLAGVPGALVAIPIASGVQVLARRLIAPWMRSKLNPKYSDPVVGEGGEA